MSTARLFISYASCEAFFHGEIDGAHLEVRIETYRRGLQRCRDITPDEFALLLQFEEPFSGQDVDCGEIGRSYSEISMVEDAMMAAPANPLIEEILQMIDEADFMECL